MTRPRSIIRNRSALLLLAASCLGTVPAFAASPISAGRPAHPVATAAPGTPAQETAATPVRSTTSLPAWEPPAHYSVDMVITHGKDRFIMTRHIDGARLRTDITGGGQDMTMIELGDEAGTSYTVMPKEKRAMKQSMASLQQLSGAMGKRPDA